MRLIFDFESYRVFLREHYRSQKAKNPSFSYSVFARQLGLSSSSHIQLILSGKRNLTVHNIHKIAEALGLPRAELEFFEALVHANQAETASERNYYQKKLSTLLASKPKSSSRIKTSQLLSNGLLPALLVSIEGKTRASAESVGSQFGYSAERMRELLERLEAEGIIKVELQTQFIRLSQRHLILHDKKARAQAQRQFLSRQLQLSTRAFERMYERDAKFYAHTFTISPSQQDVFVDEIRKLIECITRLSDEQPNEAVMQLNIQLFPYTKDLVS